MRRGEPALEPTRGVVQRRSTAALFDLEHRSVPAPLARYMDHLWSVNWRNQPDGGVDTAVIPFPSVHLTLEWGTDHERHGHPLPSVLVHGVVTSLFQIALRGTGGVLGVRFRPGGFASWFNVADVSTLNNRVVPAEEIIGARLASTLGRMAEHPSGDSAERLIALLSEAVPEPTAEYLALSHLIDEMRDDPSLVRVEQLAERSGWSLRTIQRLFNRAVGVSPKWVLNRFRLHQAALALEENPDLSLAGLAHTLGWYDQAHFTREFRRMLGSTPGEYATLAARVAH